MAKLKRKKGLKDVTGDGKFTFADVLKMRGVKPKKSMDVGGRLPEGYGYSKSIRQTGPMYKMPRLIVGGMPSVPNFDDYETVPTEFTPEMIRRLRSNARSKVAQGLKPSVEDYYRMDIIDNPEKDLAMYDKPFATGLEQKPMMERKSDILRERGLVDPMRLNIPEDMAPMSSRKPGEIMGYGGKVRLKSQGKGGVVEYGLGGAVMGGINALMAGKGLAGAAGAAAKGMATPGSGIGAAAQLAGNLAAKSNNPMLQNIGKMAGMASNFLPGGNPMNALQGLFQQRHGGYVSPKHMLRRG